MNTPAATQLLHELAFYHAKFQAELVAHLAGTISLYYTLPGVGFELANGRFTPYNVPTGYENACRVLGEVLDSMVTVVTHRVILVAAQLQTGRSESNWLMGMRNP